MIVVAVSGWKGSGKDTMADYLVDEYGYTRIAFADVLKEMVAEQYDIPLNSCHEPYLKEVPLMQYPVESEDKFGAMIHNFMVKEFRTRDGKIPTLLTNTDDGTKGLIPDADGNYDHYEEVFWTPRALCILEGSIKRAANSSYWVQNVIRKISKLSEEDPRTKVVISDLRYQSEVGHLDHAFETRLVTCRVNRWLNSPSSDPSERDLDEYVLDYKIDNGDTIDEFKSVIDDFVAVTEGSMF